MESRKMDVELETFSNPLNNIYSKSSLQNLQLQNEKDKKPTNLNMIIERNQFLQGFVEGKAFQYAVDLSEYLNRIFGGYFNSPNI